LTNEWQDVHHAFEKEWWGDCINTFGEETKQITYAHRMGLTNVPVDGHWPVYDLASRKILDVGSGPSSILLKCINVGKGSTVLDPIRFPDWVHKRYEEKKLVSITKVAEKYVQETEAQFDEVWIYNVLQHVIDPFKIVKGIREMAPILRIFEWIEHPAAVGHPHVLHARDLDQWLKGHGQIEQMDENGCQGMAYYGTFEYIGA